MKNTITAISSLLVIFALSSSVFACACCADRGTYDLWSGVPDEYRLGLLKEMDLAETAELYSTEAGFETIKGLSALEKEYNDGGLTSLDLVDAYTNNVWKFTLKSPGGQTGTLTLPRPAKMTFYKADHHESEGNDAILYKEMIFNGNVSAGSGIFKKSIVAKTTYTLVFQGKGNYCDNSSDFTHWRLELKGTKASYAFFGRMKGTS